MPAKVSSEAESLMFDLFTDFDYDDDVKQNIFANTVVNAPVFQPDRKDEVSPVIASQTSKIEDFGEKIGGARKDMYSVYKNLLSYAAMSEVDKLPFSKAWPKPNYEKLLATGVESWRVSAIRALRETVDSIPRRYHHSFEVSCVGLRDCAVKVMDGTINSFEDLRMKVRGIENDSRYDLFRCLFQLYEKLGHTHELPPFSVYMSTTHNEDFSKSYQEWMIGELLKKHSYCMKGSYSAATLEEALEKFGDTLKERYSSDDLVTYSVHGKKSPLPQKPKDLSKVYNVYWFKNRETAVKEYYICRKVGKNLIKVKGPFEDSQYAFMFKNEHLQEVDERFHAMKNLPNERGEENQPRQGERRRTGDVTPEDFMKAFGFRGVEFGNYVEGSRRQQDLNDAYDALMDLAQIIGVPSRALSLGGKLGLAFGARGHGGKHPALAHYEPAKVVINLTKRRGAGSLGHEWFHALDNMVAREYDLGNTYLTESSSIIASISHVGNEQTVTFSNIELFDAKQKVCNLVQKYTQVVERSRKLDKFRQEPYWGTMREVMARTFEVYLKNKLEDAGIKNDYLVNYLDEATWKARTQAPYAYPTEEEAKKIEPYFDDFFSSFKQRTEGENIILYSSSIDIDINSLEKTRIPFDKLQPQEIGLNVFGNQVLGIETAFYNGDPRFHGCFDTSSSTIFLNRSSECDLSWVFMHEAFHAMKDADPLLYKEIFDLAGGVEAFSKEKIDAYRLERHKLDLTDESVRHEMLADAFADYITGRRAIKEMAEKQPNTVRRVLSFLSRAKDELQACFFGEKREEIEHKYPAARISQEQFNDLSHGLDYIKEELQQSQHLTKGQDILLSILATAPKFNEIIHSPFSYSPEKQFKFDCKAMEGLGELYPELLSTDIAATVTGFSPCRDQYYKDRLLSSRSVKGFSR